MIEHGVGQNIKYRRDSVVCLNLAGTRTVAKLSKILFNTKLMKNKCITNISSVDERRFVLTWVNTIQLPTTVFVSTLFCKQGDNNNRDEIPIVLTIFTGFPLHAFNVVLAYTRLNTSEHDQTIEMILSLQIHLSIFSRLNRSRGCCCCYFLRLFILCTSSSLEKKFINLILFKTSSYSF